MIGFDVRGEPARANEGLFAKGPNSEMFIVRYYVRCHACGEMEQLHEAPVDVQKRQMYLDFSLPDGWHEGVRDHYYCPRHVVVVAVMVDGKPA